MQVQYNNEVDHTAHNKTYHKTTVNNRLNSGYSDNMLDEE